MAAWAATGAALALSSFTQATVVDFFSAGEHPGAGLPGGFFDQRLAPRLEDREKMA